MEALGLRHAGRYETTRGQHSRTRMAQKSWHLRLGIRLVLSLLPMLPWNFFRPCLSGMINIIAQTNTPSKFLPLIPSRGSHWYIFSSDRTSSMLSICNFATSWTNIAKEISTSKFKVSYSCITWCKKSILRLKIFKLDLAGKPSKDLPSHKYCLSMKCRETICFL